MGGHVKGKEHLLASRNPNSLRTTLVLFDSLTRPKLDLALTRAERDAKTVLSILLGQAFTRNPWLRDQDTDLHATSVTCMGSPHQSPAERIDEMFWHLGSGVLIFGTARYGLRGVYENSKNCDPAPKGKCKARCCLKRDADPAWLESTLTGVTALRKSQIEDSALKCLAAGLVGSLPPGHYPWVHAAISKPP